MLPPRFTLTRMGRRHVATDELLARAQANDYNRGTHKERDEFHGCEKHVKKAKKDQDATLKRYVLWEKTSLTGPE